MMNEILGRRIRELRESFSLTQEFMAEQMNCSRQRYARIEKGLVDITYANIVLISDILETSPDKITSAVQNNKNTPLLFRKQNEVNGIDKFEFICEMIDKFYAHKRLHNRIKRVRDENE